MIRFPMALRFHGLITTAAFCEPLSSRMAKRELNSFKGTEMVTHATLFALTAAAMLDQKAGGKSLIAGPQTQWY